MSSTLRRSSADISPFSSLARASLMRGGGNRLQTSAARKGALVLCMSHSGESWRFQAKQAPVRAKKTRQDKLMCRSPRNAEKAFEYRGIGFQCGTGRIVDDRAALQYHNAVGEPYNLLRILLDNDG